MLSCMKQHYCTFSGKNKVSAHALSPPRYQCCEYHCSVAEISMYFDGELYLELALPPASV